MIALSGNSLPKMAERTQPKIRWQIGPMHLESTASRFKGAGR